MRKELLKNVEAWLAPGRKLKTVDGYIVEEGQTYQGKPIIAGIFVNTTKPENEKLRLFKLARKEVGEAGKKLPIYEIIDKQRQVKKRIERHNKETTN